MKYSFLLILLTILGSTSGAKILFFWGLSTYSHRIVVWELVNELTEQGHEVTFLSPYPPREPHPKVREIHPKALTDYMNGVFSEGSLLQLRMIKGHRELWFEFIEWGINMCRILTEDQEIQELVKNSKFDMVVIDALINECGIGFAYKFNAPFVNFGTSSLFQWYYDIYGISPESSWLTDMQFHPEPPMTFLEKVVNCFRPLHWYFLRHWTLFPALEESLRENFQIPNMPPLRELERNASLHFQNNFFATEVARALPPIVVPVGGIHIKEWNKKPNSKSSNSIPKNILDWIGDSSFFYISFGSATKISELPQANQAHFFSALDSFKAQGLKFIWKWEPGVQPKVPSIPSNVKLVSDWLPQQEVLKHPQLKGFLTHSGLLSIQEAIFYGVPLITVPIFAEQDYNAQKMERDGYGIRLELSEITEKSLRDSINAIVNDPSYKNRMLRISSLFKDRPLTPIETAIYWIEYILRNKDMSHLRSPGGAQSWWERRLLDVYTLLFGILILSWLTIKRIAKVVFWRTLNKSNLKNKAD